MFFEKSDVIAMQLGYAVEFIGGILVGSVVVMFVRDFIVKRWNARVRVA